MKRLSKKYTYEFIKRNASPEKYSLLIAFCKGGIAPLQADLAQKV